MAIIIDTRQTSMLYDSVRGYFTVGTAPNSAYLRPRTSLYGRAAKIW
jgi:hypothetical protein